MNPVIEWSTLWAAASVILGLVTTIAIGGAIYIKTTIQVQLSIFLEKLESKFMTEDTAKVLMLEVTRHELKPIWEILNRRQFPRKELKSCE